MKNVHEEYKRHHKLLSEHYAAQHKIAMEACKVAKASGDEFQKSQAEAHADFCKAMELEHADMAQFHEDCIDTGGSSDTVDMGTTLGPKAIIDPIERDAALRKAGQQRWGLTADASDPLAGLQAIPRHGAPSMDAADEPTAEIDKLAWAQQ